MIVVRNIFQLQFGKAKEGIPLLKEMAALSPEGSVRILADVTGDFYTMVLEETAADLADVEARARAEMSHPSWGALYARFTPLVMSGRREVFRTVE
ncbi:hypothetical protein HNQ07_000880 [Deinococcus metalli]|uniref:NIPSNAP domain-containing protein n=1 Tax=Deinococcus metalli TaxID=1141878 RepID=A0A7W8KEB3_9DEIO|nr:hypothetical protein [Deinococcus metalli]MBB5375436.1 hypothetical protein [Deinococcus metalli]GHF29297.1 hypothetical protein GCM10017781_01590 [Deinococcus metalli]